MHATGIIRPAEKIVRGVLNPVFQGLHSVKLGVQGVLDPLYLDRTLIDQMRTEVHSLQVENAYLRQFEVENNRLRKALDFKKRKAHTGVLAHIIGTSIEQNSHVYILDRGSNDSIKRGSAVIAEDGVFVGTISSVQPSISFLLLPNDDRSSIIVSIMKNGVEVSGIAHGKFRIGIVIDKMQQITQVEQGDSVVTSSLNTGIPQGLLVGTVRDVISSANDLFQEATLAPLLSYDSLRIVTILTQE